MSSCCLWLLYLLVVVAIFRCSIVNVTLRLMCVCFGVYGGLPLLYTLELCVLLTSNRKILLLNINVLFFLFQLFAVCCYFRLALFNWMHLCVHCTVFVQKHVYILLNVSLSVYSVFVRLRLCVFDWIISFNYYYNYPSIIMFYVVGEY